MFIKRHAFGLIFLILTYTLLLTYHYYDNKQVILRSTQENIENMLLYNRAISNFVAHVQRPQVNQLCQSENTEFFSPELQSSSYITKTISQYVNIERQKLHLNSLRFKWASLNPMNPENAANNIEQGYIRQIVQNPDLHIQQVKENEDKTYVYYAIAGQMIEKSCLRCHASPDTAPKAMVELYGRDNGYGYQVGELSSIVSIRADISQQMEELKNNTVKDGIALLFILIVLYVLVAWIVSIIKNLENNAVRDPMTHLLNRRLYQDMFEKELSHCRSETRYLGHFLLDIDFFKQYNDTYGHPAGDEILIQIAEEIEYSFQRVSDFVFRIGGEEFAIICSSKEKENFMEMGNNLCKNIEHLNLEHNTSLVNSVVTISIGICIVDCSKPVSFSDVYKTADEALYIAKTQGRNRIHIIEL